MSKFFISGSTQERNLYKGGGNEEFYMQQVASFVALALIEAGHSVKMGGTTSASINAKTANAWGADYYIAIHSNAGGGDGTVVFYKSKSTKGRKLADAVYTRVAKLSPGKDDGVRTGDKFVEINTPKAAAILVEVEYHDSKVGAKHIRENIKGYADAIARGALDVAGCVQSSKPYQKPYAGTEPPTSRPVLSRVLKLTKPLMSGPDVRRLQKKLGFNVNGADGIFGKMTHEAVVQFQRKHGLLADGIVGKKTADALGWVWKG